MAVTYPYLQNNQNVGSRGGSEKIFTVIHVERTAPEAICFDLIAAKDQRNANEAAKRLFPHSTILRVAAKESAETAYPDARFIKGEFHPVKRTEELAWNDD
ncbi:MAG: hypothetical protein WD407_02130 [Rhodospirillales bacterium]